MSVDIRDTDTGVLIARCLNLAHLNSEVAD